ncbi:alpha/beta hydrolase [Spirosoma pomorum]
MKRILLITGLILAVLVVGYLAGPTAEYEQINEETITVDPDLVKLEQSITKSERNAKLRPDNEARIIWADSSKKVKTPYSLIYLPGFTASWAEGDPVHKQLAKAFGCNLYLARTAGHGVNSPDALEDMTPTTYAASAERALTIGKALGEKVVVIGTSAGGMLSLYLAAHHPEIHGLILYSPCIATANSALQLVTKPWGKQLMSQIFGGEHVTVTWHKPERARYWLQTYHTNGLITLQTMLERFMTPEQFRKVKQPVFLGYYYKDEANQDKVVSVPAMLAMYDQLGTAVDQKRKVAFPKAGEHVIASRLTSGDVNGVYQATKAFMEQVLMMPLQTDSAPIKAMLPKK